MNITTNYSGYDNYYKTSGISAYNNMAVTSAQATIDTEEDSTSLIGLSQSSATSVSDLWALLKNNFSGMDKATSLQSTSRQDNIDSKEVMDKIKASMDAIKELNIEDMTDEEVKEALGNFQSALQDLQHPHEKADAVLNTDLESMSATEMRDMLNSIQSDALHGPGGDRRPPMEPMDLTQFLEDLSTTLQNQTSTSDVLSSMDKLIQAIKDNYDNTEDISNDDLTEIKSKLSELFDQQKQSIDSISSQLFSQLDQWSTTLSTNKL